jgi:hypothetical protein
MYPGVRSTESALLLGIAIGKTWFQEQFEFLFHVICCPFYGRKRGPISLGPVMENRSNWLLAY